MEQSSVTIRLSMEGVIFEVDFPCPQHVLQGREQRTQGAWGGQGEGASQSMPVIIATHKQVKGVVGNRAPESRPIRPLRPAPPPVCVHFMGWEIIGPESASSLTTNFESP